MSEICGRMHILFNDLPRCRFPFNEQKIPRNGIYILFEKGEFAHRLDRIVRVGTHTGTNQLPSRLKQHFINENKDRSIFRKNIGRAKLNKENDPFLEQWEWDLTTKKAKERYSPLLDSEKQCIVEKDVSECIQQSFSFVAFRFDEKKDRLQWEQKIISTLSWCEECCPSPQWLGMHSPKQKIRENGLWQVNGLFKDGLSLSDLEVLEELVQANPACRGHGFAVE